jgi:photosystem II stability/assembly factor-like uncharacterized protein
MNKLAGWGCALLIPALGWASGWQQAGPFGGSATAVAVDPSNPSTLLLGARNSLIYRSVDAGATWSRLPFPRHFLGTVTALAIDPADPSRYYAALSAEHSYYGGLWISSDAGQTWELSEDLQGKSAEAIAIWAKDPSVIVVGTRAGVWRSRDRGANWERISAPWNHEMRIITAVAIDPVNADVIYAGTTHLPWKTTGGGKDWKIIHAGMLDDSDVFSIFIDPLRPNVVLASACSGIYRSESAGEKWTKFPGIPASHRRTHVIRLHPEKPNVIYAGTTLGLLKSVNGGAVFRQVNQLHILSMAFDPSNPERIYFATERSGLWRSDDGGETAKPWNHGFVNRKVLGMTEAGGRLYANTIQDGEAGGVYASDDGGRTWQLAANGARIGDNHIQSVAGHPSKPDIVFAANERRLLRTTDGGKSWKALALPGRPGQTRVGAVHVQEHHGVFVFLGTSQGLYRSPDLGATWQPVPLVKANIPMPVTGLVAAGPRMLVRTAHALYLSEDYGSSWRPLNLLFPTSEVYDIALSERAGDPILLATAKGLFRSEDGGRTWFQKDRGLVEGTVSSVRYQPGGRGRVWAVQFSRLYVSPNGGIEWSIVEQGEIPESTIRSLWTGPAHPGRLFALTPDLGMFYLELHSLQVHNKERQASPVP